MNFREFINSSVNQTNLKLSSWIHVFALELKNIKKDLADARNISQSNTNSFFELQIKTLKQELDHIYSNMMEDFERHTHNVIIVVLCGVVYLIVLSLILIILCLRTTKI